MTAQTGGGHSSTSFARRARRTRALASTAILGLVALTACARDRELEMPVQVPQGGPQAGPQMGANVGPNAFNPPPPQVVPSVASATPPPAPKPSATNGLPPAALPPLEPVPPPAPPASSSAPPVKPTGTPVGGGDLAELYRAQDQCLSSCDQFACMKIAAAYKTGGTVPKDPLAGRRYAMHACQECGVAGPGIADQCPGYQLTPKASP